MNINDLKGTTVALLASGGLDSCTVTHWLNRHGVTVICITADLGQPDEPDLEAVKTRLLASGASESVIVDAKEQVAEFGMAAIRSRAKYEGDYWNTTGLARYVTVEAALDIMMEKGINILAHGATGRGNDQVRFQIATNMLAPEIGIYAPWRDQAFVDAFGGRKEMIDYCNANGVPIQQSHEKPYSTDANMLGLTHEAGILESLDTPVSVITPGMGVFPTQATDTAESFSITFLKGEPVTINGENVPSLTEAFRRANEIAGRNALGIGSHLVENRIVGIKSRGVYEAPGMELMGTCFEYLLQTLLDRRSRKLYDMLSPFIAEQIYEGYMLGPASIAALTAVEDLVCPIANGTVTVTLYKGTALFKSIVPSDTDDFSLYMQSDASMENVGPFKHSYSEGFLKVLSIGAKTLNKQVSRL